jgi:hypothetical protein
MVKRDTFKEADEFKEKFMNSHFPNLKIGTFGKVNNLYNKGSREKRVKVLQMSIIILQISVALLIFWIYLWK